jgi:hypothetical protein
MKYLSLFFIMIGSIASAHVLEVNEAEKIVYYAPTPVLSVTLVDLESEGGVLNLLLDYDGATAKKENTQIKESYPGYQVQAVVVQPTNQELQVNIPEIGVSERTLLKQAQMGPLLSMQLGLKPEQVRKFKIMERSQTPLKIEIPIRTSIHSSQTIESYSTESTACRDLKVRNVADLITSLGSLKKPGRIQYAQTFESYKSSLLQNCFDISPTYISSFKELLKMELKPHVGAFDLKGSYVETRAHDIEAVLVPTVQIDIN